MRKRQKTLSALLLALLCLSLTRVTAFATADDIEQTIEDELSKYDLSEWEDSLPDNNPLFGDSSAQELIEAYINGETPHQPDDILSGITDILRDILAQNVFLLLAIIAVAATSGLSNALMPQEKGDLRELSSFIILIMTAGVLTAVFSKACATAAQAIEGVADFSNVAAPVLALMLTATGSNATSGVISPLMAFLSSGVAGIINTVILPLILFGGTLLVISTLSKRIRLKNTVSLLKTLVKWSLGLLSTVYMGTLGIRGLVAASHDGLGIKTVKYIIDKGVPVAGGIVSGTMDTVLYCASIVKSAAGAAAQVIVFSIIAIPLLEILGTMLTLRLGAALSEPIGGEDMAKMLSGLADWVSYMFAVTAVVGAMLMITVGLMASVYGG